MTRLVIVTAVLLGLPGCATSALWRTVGAPWPVATRSYRRVEAAGVDREGALFVRISRDRAGDVVYRIDNPVTSDPDAFVGEIGTRVSNDDFPGTSEITIRVLGSRQTEDLVSNRNRKGLATGQEAFLIVGIYTLVGATYLTIWDSRRPDALLRGTLPNPSIAWETPNALGHIALTPIALTIDAALWPFELVAYFVMCLSIPRDS